MDSSTTGSLSKNGQTLADQAADKAQGGIRDAQQAAKDAFARAQSIGRQGIDAVSDAAQRARDVASDTSDSVIRYTRANPVKAILIAAASGALIVSVIQLLKPSRRN